MQSLVDTVSNAADATNKFGRIEDELIASAKDKHYPLHFAWERRGEFAQSYRADEPHDTNASARFAIVAKASNYTFSELESLFTDLVGRVMDADKSAVIVDFDSFDADFGGARVRIAVYEMRSNTLTEF